MTLAKKIANAGYNERQHTTAEYPHGPSKAQRKYQRKNNKRANRIEARDHMLTFSGEQHRQGRQS